MAKKRKVKAHEKRPGHPKGVPGRDKSVVSRVASEPGRKTGTARKNVPRKPARPAPSARKQRSSPARLRRALGALDRARMSIARAVSVERESFRVAEVNRRLAETNARLRGDIARERRARADEAREREEAIRAQVRAQEQVKRDREEARRKAALSESEVVQEILARMPRETADAYVSRVDRAMRRLGYHHDAWYANAAHLFDMTERDFYTLVVSPKVGR
jgi:hypothetical protein